MTQTITPSQEKRYTYDEFFKKNRGGLVVTVKQMGFQPSDAQDIIHDAIFEFFRDRIFPSEENLTRQIIETVVKPMLYGYIASAADNHAKQLNWVPLEKHEVLTWGEALQQRNPPFYLLLEYLESIPAHKAENHPPYLLVNPWDESSQREDIRRIYEQLYEQLKIAKEPEIPHDLHHTRRDEIRDSRFRAELIRNKKQEIHGDNYTGLRRYARHWKLSNRMASRLAKYARVNGLPCEQAETLVEKVATRPQARGEFLVGYKQLLQR